MMPPEDSELYDPVPEGPYHESLISKLWRLLVPRFIRRWFEERRA